MTAFAASGGSAMTRTARGVSPLILLAAVGQSYLYPVAPGRSSMLIPLYESNLIETGTADDLVESGAQPDNIVETGEA